MNKEKLLSIIVPVYNTERYIKRCIVSILEQRYKNIEIVIVDDGSSDGSLRICKEFQSDERVRVISKQNEGPMLTRLLGVEEAKGEYVTFVDSDDWVDRDMYYELMQDVNSRNVDVSMCGIVRAYKDEFVYEPPLIDNGIYEGEGLELIKKRMIWDSKYECNALDQSLCTKVIRRELVYKYMRNAKDLRIHYNEDTAIVFPLMMEVSKISITDGCFYYHWQRECDLPYYLVEDTYFEKMFSFYRYLTRIMGREYQSCVEQYFLYSINQRKRMYTDLSCRNTCYYPIEYFDMDTKFVIYGAGNIGQELYAQYERIHLGKLVGWVDQKKVGQTVFGVKLINIIDLKEVDFDYIVLAIFSEPDAKSIREMLKRKGIAEEKILWKQVKVYENS